MSVLDTGAAVIVPEVNAIEFAVIALKACCTVQVFAESLQTERPAGQVTNTSLLPVVNETNAPPLDDDKTVSRERVLPEDVYVPMPTSHEPVD